MLNLKFAFRHFLHRLKATNRHGLHSPFVYRLVDKVIYDFAPKNVYAELQKLLPEGKKLNEVDKLIYRIVHHAQPESVYFSSHVTAQQRELVGHASPQATGKSGTRYDLIFLDVTDLDSDYEPYVAKADEGTLLLVNYLYLNKETWSELKTDPKVTVTVDLFFIGLVWFRQGQVKENFLIKF